jgi:hypothetical protein
MRSMGGVGRREEMRDGASECEYELVGDGALLQRSANEIEYSTVSCWLEIRAC